MKRLALTWSGGAPTLAATVYASIFPTIYRHGTVLAASGFLAMAVYYDLAWRSLKHRLNVLRPLTLEPRPWSEFQYLAWGAGASVLCFVLAGAADAPPTFLDTLVGALMGLCGAVFGFMFGFGLVALWNLWRECIQQLRGAMQFRRSSQSYDIKPPSLVPAVPLALLGLAFGIGVFVVLGMITPYLERWHIAVRELLWIPIATMFYALWKGRSYAALLLRLILLVLFSVIILGFVVWLLAWIASQTAPLLVTMLAGITVLNAAFYARWVRLPALRRNFQ